METLKRQRKRHPAPPAPNLWEQMRGMMQDELTSAQRASLGAQLLLERKRDKARLKAERDALQAKLQMDLFETA